MDTPTPDQLRQGGYRLLLALPHDKLNAFSKTYYFQRITWITLAHYAFCTVLMIAWLLLGMAGRYESHEWLLHFTWAALFFLALVPIHEGIHALMYRLYGAPTVKVATSLRKLYVYAIAPYFVMNRQQFAWVVITPFIAVTVLLTAGMAFLAPIRHLLLGAMVIHTGGTSGDFAMLSYLWIQRKRGLLTFDDEAEQISYFYEVRG